MGFLGESAKYVKFHQEHISSSKKPKEALTLNDKTNIKRIKAIEKKLLTLALSITVIIVSTILIPKVFDTPKEYVEFYGIKVAGTEFELDKTNRALSIINKYAPEMLDEVKTSLQTIEFHERGSGMNTLAKKFVVKSGSSILYDDLYFASCIIHDATHGRQPTFMNPAERETDAIQKQIDFLKKASGEPFALLHIESLESIKNNPKYQEIPYDKRDW